MVQRGKSRYEKRLARSKDKGLESKNPPHKHLLREAAARLERAIHEWIEFAQTRPGKNHAALPYIQKLPLDLVAGLTTRAVLDQISRKNQATTVCLKIGAVLEDEWCFRQISDEHYGLWKKWSKRAKPFRSYAKKRNYILRKANASEEVQLERWAKDVRLKIGAVLLELLASATGIVEIRQEIDFFKRKFNVVEAAESTLLWLEKSHEESALLDPIWLPCVEPPRDWTGVTDGGYHALTIPMGFMKVPQRVLSAMRDADLEQVYQAMNRLQRTSWAVNDRVLKVLEHYWENGFEFAGLPPRFFIEPPPKPADIATNEEARYRWRLSARDTWNLNAALSSKRLQISQMVHTARQFREDALWFVHQLDWRGRAYPVVAPSLSPQGTDLSKALLQFAEGKPLDTPESLSWLRIHGANCWGLDKASYEERVLWAEDNAEHVLRVADDPLANTWWHDADEPWQFLAWCLDYAGFLADPINHRSALPCHQDATQSGIQIMSLLLRDESGGAATNCTASDKPQDLYGLVADKVIEQLEASDDREHADYWLEFGIDRSACKRPVMTRVYNATLSSAAGYTREWALDTARSRSMDALPTAKQTWALTREIWTAMESVLVGTKACQDWLREVASLFAQHNVSLRYTTPVGLPFRQDYRKYKTRLIKTRIGEVIRQNAIREDLDDIDIRKMKSALAPNFIHSLDAAAMVRTVNVGFEHGITHMGVVHDSFCTHAADADLMYAALREAYIALFTPDLLRDLKEQLETQLPPGVEIPEPPAYGNLNVEDLRESPYFFN